MNRPSRWTAPRAARFDWRLPWVCSVFVFGQPQSGKLPARRRIKEIAISHARMAGRRRQRRAAQYYLIDHEFTVVFAERARRRPVAGIRRIDQIMYVRIV